MEAVGFVHCSASLLGGSKRSLVSGNRNGVLRFKDSGSAGHSSAFFLRVGGEFSSSGRSESEWLSLHVRAPLSRPVQRRVTSFGQSSTDVDDPVKDPELKKQFVEEVDKLLLKQSAKKVVDDLQGTSIFLVGMMGSGKTTVGRFIAENLGYYFFDSDKLIEDAAGGTTVAQMFQEGREDEFRNAETETLMQLSAMGRLVVATGGGAVIRPQNWGYLRHGITIWLDVPVDTLARRVVAVGCHSRPLLGQISEETAYYEALKCLGDILEERKGYYSNADAVVSVAAIAGDMGLEDVAEVTPIMLAIQVLEEIARMIAEKKNAMPQF